MIEAVRPAALLPLPDVYTDIGETFQLSISLWKTALQKSELPVVRISAIEI